MNKIKIFRLFRFHCTIFLLKRIGKIYRDVCYHLSLTLHYITKFNRENVVGIFVFYKSTRMIY